MIQPTGRIISEELFDTMRKSFPNKVFSPPPARLPPSAGPGQALSPSFCLQMASRLWSPQQKRRLFAFSSAEPSTARAQRAQGCHPVPREQAAGRDRSHRYPSDAKTPGQAQLQCCNCRTADFRSRRCPQCTHQAYGGSPKAKPKANIYKAQSSGDTCTHSQGGFAPRHPFLHNLVNTTQHGEIFTVRTV